jgi:aminoglycoside 6'-N-acetyltransferase I
LRTGFFQISQLDECAHLLIQAYNPPPWNNRWSFETAVTYLQEIIDTPRFVGFVVSADTKLVGAAFCHARTWWSKDELYIAELFVSPEFQRQGYGAALIKQIENFVNELDLSGFTLLTDKNMPAREFYKKHGVQQNEQIIFLYKRVT